MRKKKNKEDGQNLEEWKSALRHSEAKCQLVQTSHIKRIEFFLFLPYNKHLINRTKSVCMGESWPWSFAQTSLRSVCTYDLGQDSPIQTSRLIRAKYKTAPGGLYNIFEAWLLSSPPLPSRQVNMADSCEWTFRLFGRHHCNSRIFEKMDNFQNDCCRPWTKKPFKNSCSRQLRIVNASG